ncbi:hypothetical protein ACFSTH_10280 [Paenibacillus yanchengensis]
MNKYYEIMGLPAASSKDEVEKRYDLLLKRERERQKTEQRLGQYLTATEQMEHAEAAAQFAEITNAFNRILDYENQVYAEKFNEQEYGKYRKLSTTAQKFDHFWRYYKVHTISAILAVVLIVYGVIAFIDKQEEKRYLASLPPVDVSVTFLGNFATKDNDSNYVPINEAFLSLSSNWQRFDADIVYVPPDEMSQVAYLQRALVVVASEFEDVYVMDEFMLQWFGGQGGLVDLETIPNLKPLLKEENSKKFATEEDPTMRTYAIKMDPKLMMEKFPILGRDFYIGVRVNAERKDNAFLLLEQLLKLNEKR